MEPEEFKDFMAAQTEEHPGNSRTARRSEVDKRKR